MTDHKLGANIHPIIPHRTKDERPEQYDENRRCIICAAKLSRYNPNDKCYTHKDTNT